MPLPDDFYDEDKNYRIRLCMLLTEAIAVAPGSKINPCDSCGELVWVNETQEIPPLPEGMVLSGDVSVCRNCASEIFQKSDVAEPDFLLKPPDELLDKVKKYFGMTKP
jgi:hypothetical protein